MELLRRHLAEMNERQLREHHRLRIGAVMWFVAGAAVLLWVMLD